MRSRSGWGAVGCAASARWAVDPRGDERRVGGLAGLQRLLAQAARVGDGRYYWTQRLMKLRDTSQTSRQPWSMTRPCPRLGMVTVSVMPGFLVCFL
jgi:hypothetical protein